jgi:hypothetical protein
MTNAKRNMNRSLLSAIVCLICSIQGSSQAVQAAALSSAGVVNAINQADVFAGESRFSVKVDGEHVSISTYKPSIQDDTENKMQSIFATKAIMEAAPGQVTRVSFYYYDYDHLSSGKYKQVDVTAGDIKAFGSGQLKEQELLSSISITEGQLPDEASRISSYLASKQDYPVTTTLKDDEIVINSQIDNRSSQTDFKYRALKLATEAVDAAPRTIKRVRVDLATRRENEVREVAFNVAVLKSIMSRLNEALAPVTIISRKDATAITPVEGVLKPQREELLKRINELARNGVGVTPFLTAFAAMEKQVAGGDESKIGNEIKRLSDSVETQEKAYKDAKTAKPTTPKAAESSAAPPVAPSQKISRWILGTEPILESRVLNDPDAYIKELEAKVTTPQTKPDDNPRFAGALMFFAQTLRAHNRPDDAVRFEQRLAQIRAKHPKF